MGPRTRGDMAESWAKTGSGVGKQRAGKRAKPAREQKKKKTPEELALSREAARNDRDERALYPTNCDSCGVSMLGPKGGQPDEGVEIATSPPGREPYGKFIRQRFCSPAHMAATAAEGEA